MANSSNSTRIGLCVICENSTRQGNPGMVGYFITNTGPAPSHFVPQVCKVCDGKGYVYFRSDK